MFLLLLLLVSVVVAGAAIVDDGESHGAEEAEPDGGLHQLVVLAPRPGLGPALQLVGQVVLGATVTCFVHNIAPVWDSN